MKSPIPASFVIVPFRGPEAGNESRPDQLTYRIGHRLLRPPPEPASPLTPRPFDETPLRLLGFTNDPLSRPPQHEMKKGLYGYTVLLAAWSASSEVNDGDCFPTPCYVLH